MPRKTQSPVTIRELKSKDDWRVMYPLIRQLNKDMDRKTYESILVEMKNYGYRCVGAFAGGKLVGVTGFWVGYRFWCHKFIDLDHVVVDEKLRGKGIGKKMVAWVEREGKRLKCRVAGLDSYATAHASHRFYFREGYCILGYHFMKKLQG